MAALTQTNVMNQALRLVGADQIEDPSEGSESARQVRPAFDFAVHNELETSAWGFAKKQAALPADSEAPIYKYAFAYQLPSDFLRLVELEGRWVFSTIRGVDTNPIPDWEIQGKKLLTNLPAPLNITYISDVTEDVGAWHWLFASAVAAATAEIIAKPLTKSDSAVQLASTARKTAVSRAIRVNAIQQPPQLIPDASWLVARMM